MPPHKKNERHPIAEELSRKGISLPSSVNLSTEEIAYITDIISKP
jgi:dTDP-4-amino-4,6-dideoxygalactose transaminase